MQEHCDRLVAARLQADIMGTDTVIVARTDGEAASLLDNNVDARDHPYILGATNPNAKYVSYHHSFSLRQLHSFFSGSCTVSHLRRSRPVVMHA
jgi:isocitrate lyase